MFSRLKHLWDIFYHEIWQRIILYGLIFWAMYMGVIGTLTDIVS